jgi:hypothetical protein
MAQGTTLADLVEGLGYEVVRVEVAPSGLDVPVGDPMIHDRLAGTSFAAADVVLAVGVDQRAPEMLDLLEAAGRAGAAARCGVGPVARVGADGHHHGAQRHG